MDASIREWTADCSRHHHQFPTDGSPPVIRGYDAFELKDILLDIWALGARARGGTPKLRQLRYELITEYSYADFSTATIGEIEKALESWGALIDQYFFAGALTQGPERRASVYLSFIRSKRALGETLYVTPEYARVHISLTRPSAPGRRRTKGDLLTTLVHEMAHAFVGVYYNRCPAVPGEAQQEYDARGGHGDIWYSYNYVMARAVFSWLPEIASERELPERFPCDLCLDYQFWTRYLAIDTTLPWPLSRGGQTALEARRAGLVRSRRELDLKGKLIKVRACVCNLRTMMTLCCELVVFVLVSFLYGFRRFVQYLSVTRVLQGVGLLIAWWILTKLSL
jgi:hypothetical protein